MVEHRLRPHEIHHPVEALGGEALEEGVLFPGGAHAVDHIAPGVVLLHHGVHRVNVVLEVGVHGDGHVAPLLRRHQPRQQGILVPPVAGEIRPAEQGAPAMQPGDELPRPVPGAVVDKQHPAPLRDFARRHQLPAWPAAAGRSREAPLPRYSRGRRYTEYLPSGLHFLVFGFGICHYTLFGREKPPYGSPLPNREISSTAQMRISTSTEGFFRHSQFRQ